MSDIVFNFEKFTRDNSEFFIERYKKDLLQLNFRMALHLKGDDRLDTINKMLPEIRKLPPAHRSSLGRTALNWAIDDNDVELAKFFPENVVISCLEEALSRELKDLARYFALCDVDLNKEIDEYTALNVGVAKKLFPDEPEILDVIVKMSTL